MKYFGMIPRPKLVSSTRSLYRKGSQRSNQRFFFRFQGKNPVSRQIVWQYTAEDSGLPPWTFFSSFVSNAQRLPNGNTLINEGMQGRIFQVTPGGDVAWEYHSPYTGHGVAGEPEVSEPRVPGVDRLTQTRLVYRAQAVPASWVPEMTRGPVRFVDASPRLDGGAP